VETAADGPARIVVADDDRIARELMAGILRGAGHTVDVVEDGQEAVDRVAQGGVDLVLLDIVMPRLSGIEACRLLKGMTLDAFLPVMLVTVKTDTASRVEGLRIGADDYVCKPFDESELVARVAAMLRIKRLHEQIVQQKARFERLSVHDELTGLYNYRFLHTRLNEEFKRAERYHEPFACLLVDIDQLRAFNDVGGRGAGDMAIRRVAEAIKRSVRDVDVVARYGGEEFLAVLPSTHFAGSVSVAERIWREVQAEDVEATSQPPVSTRPSARPPPKVESEGPRSERRPGASARPPPNPDRVPSRPPPRPDAGPTSERKPASIPPAKGDPKWADGPRPLTVSIGVALYPSRDIRTKDALLKAAEAALTQAKRDGGNRICVYQQAGYIYSPSLATAPAAEGEKRARPESRPPPPSARPRMSQDSWWPPDSERGRKGS
jgi:diguanylate cyclase (GGDEF)-like protein